MNEFKDAGRIIVSRYRNEEGDLENGVAYGPYPSKEAAEKSNLELGFSDPGNNEVIRLWSVINEDMEISMLDVDNPIHTTVDHEFLERLMELASRVEFGMQCKIKIGRDNEIINGRYYFQIACWRMDVITKKYGWGYGGKAYLSRHMTDSELFQIMFGLYKGYWEHEARENMTVDGVRPFGPHISTEALISVARKVDVRSAKHVEDRDIPFDTRNEGMGSSVFDGGPVGGSIGGFVLNQVVQNPPNPDAVARLLREANKRRDLS